MIDVVCILTHLIPRKTQKFVLPLLIRYHSKVEILPWFSGLDKPQFNAVYISPKREVLADKFRAIVASNIGRLSPEGYDVVQHFGQFGGRDAMGSLYPKILSRAFVHHVDDPNALLLFSNDPFAYKVHRPAFINLFRRQEFQIFALDPWFFRAPVQAQAIKLGTCPAHQIRLSRSAFIFFNTSTASDNTSCLSCNSAYIFFKRRFSLSNSLSRLFSSYCSVSASFFHL